MAATSLDRIRDANPTLARQIELRGCFIADVMLTDLIQIGRLMPVVVRMGCGRFTCAVQDVKHLVNIIEEHRELKQAKTGGEEGTDYIRDISLVV